MLLLYVTFLSRSRRVNFSWVIDDLLAGHQGPISDQDLSWLKQHGILALVRLIKQERDSVTSSHIVNQGMWDCHKPVPDFSTPKPEQVDKIIQFIDISISSQRPVGVSCMAGLGRTGTILACYLVSKGHDADAAINEVRNKRPGSIETEAQENVVKAYAVKH